MMEKRKKEMEDVNKEIFGSEEEEEEDVSQDTNDNSIL